jgi:hypothetical protein
MNYKQMDIMTLIEEGEKLRDAGIQQASDNAENNNPGWNQKAFNLFSTWIKERGTGRQFKVEDFRVHCELGELIERPPHDRAYGSLAIRAVKAGLIKKIGYATVINPKAHRTPCTLWQVV